MFLWRLPTWLAGCHAGLSLSFVSRVMLEVCKGLLLEDEDLPD